MKKLLGYLCNEANKLDVRRKPFLLWGLGILLCANGFAFLNYMPKHDAINHMFFSAGEWEVRLGRFFQPYYVYLRGNVVSPWLVGLIGAAFAVMSVFMILDIMGINNPVYQILASGFLVANLSVTELCGIYIYIYDCCMIALFFSSLAVWCWLHIRHPWNLAFGAACIVLSMGFYQAYVGVTVVLCVVVLLRKALDNISWRDGLYHVFMMGLMIIIGGGIYLLLYKIFLFLWHTTATDGANGMQRLATLSVGAIFQNMIQTYQDVLRFFILDSRYFGKIVCLLHGVLLLAGVIEFLVLLIRKKLEMYNRIMLVLLFITLPIWCNLTGVVQGGGIVLRSAYALYLLFPICLMIVEEAAHISFGKQMRYLTGFICLFLLVRNVQYSNIAYMYARVTYDRTVSIMTRILEDIEEYEGYEMGSTPVAVIGQFSENNNVEVYHGDYKFINGFNKTSTTYPQTTYNFWRSLGSPVNGIQDMDVLESYLKLSQVKQMPCYPYNGYCQMIDGVLVVKISEVF